MSEKKVTGLSALIGAIVKDKGPDMKAIGEVIDAAEGLPTMEDIFKLVKLRTVRIVSADCSKKERYAVVNRVLKFAPGVMMYSGELGNANCKIPHYPNSDVGYSDEPERKLEEAASMVSIMATSDVTLLLTKGKITVATSRYLPSQLCLK